MSRVTDSVGYQDGMQRLNADKAERLAVRLKFLEAMHVLHSCIATLCARLS